MVFLIYIGDCQREQLGVLSPDTTVNAVGQQLNSIMLELEDSDASLDALRPTAASGDLPCWQTSLLLRDLPAALMSHSSQVKIRPTNIASVRLLSMILSCVQTLEQGHNVMS